MLLLVVLFAGGFVAGGFVADGFFCLIPDSLSTAPAFSDANFFAALPAIFVDANFFAALPAIFAASP